MGNDIVAHFDSLAPIYDEYASLNKVKSLSDYLFKIIKIDQGGNVLDVGTGTGNFGEFFLKKGADVIGFDINENMLNKIKIKGLKPVLGTCTSLPFKQGFFDIVISRQMLQYLPIRDIKKTLDEMYRVTSSSGSIVLHHISAPTDSSLEKVKKFMSVENQETTFLSCKELADLVSSAGYSVVHKEVHSAIVQETTDTFCRVRRIAKSELDYRLSFIKDDNEFCLNFDKVITYKRHYSMILASRIQ